MMMMVVEVELLSIKGTGNSANTVKVWATGREKQNKRLLLKCSLDGTKRERFAASLADSEFLFFEVFKAERGFFASKSRFNFSIPAAALGVVTQKVTKWYDCAPTDKRPADPAGKGKSWRVKSASQNSLGAVNVSLLLSLSSRVAQDHPKLRTSTASSLSSELDSLEERRDRIVNAPIEEMAENVLEAIYKRQVTENGQGRQRSASLSETSLPSSSASVGPEPVYIDFSDEEEAQHGSSVGLTPPSSPAPASEEVVPNNWNSEYQRLVEEFALICNQGSGTNFDTRQIALKLCKLEADFLSKAEQYGRMIISELFLDSEKKTIKPDNAGGVLGGAKYLVRQIGIMFKVPDGKIFLNDPIWSATKVAGRELSGIRILGSYFFGSTSSIRVSLPLACVIDYLGYRLLCSSILPISNSTLVFGCADAGTVANVKDKDPTLSLMLKECAGTLNLAPHLVGADRDPQTGRATREVEICTCIDLEGHVGLDGRYYLVDTGRIMPPTWTTDKGEVFFTHFRSEALAFLTPLSSDALSKFPSRMTQESTRLTEIQDQDIQLATDYLLGDFLKEGCGKLVAMFEQNPFLNSFDLTAEVHSVGVNMRYLGLACEAVGQCEKLAEWIQCEAIARAMKNRIRASMRQKFREGATDSSLCEVVAEILDGFFCSPLNDVWTRNHGAWLVKTLRERYRFSQEGADRCVRMLHSDKTLPVRHLRQACATTHTPVSFTLQLVCQYSGIELEPRVLEAIRGGGRHFDQRLLSINYIDLKIGLKVKHLPLIERATAFILYQQGTAAAAQSGSESAKLDYLQRAHASISRALRSSPNDSSLLALEGNILFRELALLRTLQKSQRDFSILVFQNVLTRAITCLEKAILFDSENIQARLKLAQLFSDAGNNARAEELFLQALEIQPCNTDALKRYGDFLEQNLFLQKEAEKFYLRRQKILSQQQQQFQQKLNESYGDMQKLLK